MATGTAVDVVMPQMGVSVSEGTITKWLKNVGDTVEADEPLLEISTDKVDTEVPSPGSGVVSEILVQEGETVEVGTVLARIGGEAAAAPRRSPAAEPSDSGRRRRSMHREPRPSGGQPLRSPTAAHDGQRPRPAPAAPLRLAGRRAHRRRARASTRPRSRAPGAAAA